MLNGIVSIVMSRKYFQIVKSTKGKICKPAIKLIFFLGATMGLLLWGLLIGIVVRFITGNEYALLNIALFSSGISMLPSLLGLLHTFNLIKMCCPEGCVLGKDRTG